MKRFLPLLLVAIANIAVALLAGLSNSGWAYGLIATVPLLFLGIHDLVQTRHSILRNYPVVGHFRFLLEAFRPEIHQYFVESDIDGRPFSREQRSLIYERSKNIEGFLPFGTELDVTAPGYSFMRHSITAHEIKPRDFHVEVGDSEGQPAHPSVLNISAMSYGAISPNAIEAMNQGARKGNFYHCTGEGGLSPYHLKHGGGLVWQIGTGYFGCRQDDGSFDPGLFSEQASHPAVKMIELKLSQGAKPGHGGVLPAAKVTPEIARTRKVAERRDCVSPPGHSTFHTPIELCRFLAELRDRSGGKPVGFKLCIGFESEFYSICKAMLTTGVTPDFITVDGGEGGTGAAPVEFSDSIGMPLMEALNFVHQTLIGCGLRDCLHLAASGKVFSASTLVRVLAMGADWANAARAFMMAVGCIQARLCHTNRCPVGVTTLDPSLQRGLVPADKAERVYQFHHNTLVALREILAAMGVSKVADVDDRYFSESDPIHQWRQRYCLEPRALVEGGVDGEIGKRWKASQAEEFSKL